MKLPEGGHDWKSITKRPEEFKICNTCGIRIRLSMGNWKQEESTHYKGRKITFGKYSIQTCLDALMDKTLQ